jgi:WD40 repeat protein
MILSYDLEESLSGHVDSVNTLQFSPTGDYIASGGQDGQLFIFSTKTWKPIRKYANPSPLNALAWHPTFSDTLVCGFSSGDLTTICFDGSEVNNPTIFIHWSHIP